jgi:hypothetical protein
MNDGPVAATSIYVADGDWLIRKAAADGLLPEMP